MTSTDMVIKFEDISKAIGDKKANWVAQDHPFLKLPDNELVKRLGVNVDKEQLQARIKTPPPDMAGLMNTLGRKEYEIMIPPHPFPFPLPQIVDWRNRLGRNNVTSIKDQGACGSCVSFGTTATLESMVSIEHDAIFDLSEAELLFCGGGSCGGWWPDYAVTYLLNRGISQESCFPYHDHNMACATCSERDGEAIKITQHVVLNTIADRKNYIKNVGPAVCVFAVYGDFFSYRTGVYSHVTGGLAGYHCVEVVGFNDFLKCWICKNSWGTGWGENGFFCIEYGQCQIDQSTDPNGFPFWGIAGTKWFKP